LRCDLAALLVTCGLRDYGTAKWEGGSAECDHKPTQEWIDRACNANSTAFPNGHKGQSAAAVGRWYKADGSCPACGARRVDAQLGLERVHDCLGWATGAPCGECYVCHLVAVFREVRRVLRDDGAMFLNLGDSYAGSGKGAWNRDDVQKEVYVPGVTGAKVETDWVGLKPKDLCGVPWRVALALQADGWWLRSDVIWHKPNPMPESVTDRPTRSHEYVFILTKSARYFWDAEAVKERIADSTLADKRNGTGRHTQGKNYSKYFDDESPDKAGAELPSWYRGKTFVNPDSGRNLRSVWTITTKPCKEAHFATFPPDLPEKCIKAATSERGVCPKCGKQWERVVERNEVALRPNSSSNRGDQPYLNGDSGQSPQRGSMVCESRTTGWRPGCECGLDAIPATVLDPFGGAGTTGMVAAKLGRSSVSVELNEAYCAIARKRIDAAARQGRLDL
jgi:DNA modification methylase